MRRVLGVDVRVDSWGCHDDLYGVVALSAYTGVLIAACEHEEGDSARCVGVRLGSHRLGTRKGNAGLSRHRIADSPLRILYNYS